MPRWVECSYFDGCCIDVFETLLSWCYHLTAGHVEEGILCWFLAWPNKALFSLIPTDTDTYNQRSIKVHQYHPSPLAYAQAGIFLSEGGLHLILGLTKRQDIPSPHDQTSLEKQQLEYAWSNKILTTLDSQEGTFLEILVGWPASWLAVFISLMLSIRMVYTLSMDGTLMQYTWS